MENLSLRLKSISEAGVYNMNCDLHAVRTAAATLDFAVFDADLAAVHSKGAFLAAIAQAIAAPAWMGKNWDALADVLGDLSWNPSPGYVLLLRNGQDTFNLLERDHEIAREILESNVNYWQEQGKPFWVFFC